MYRCIWLIAIAGPNRRIPSLVITVCKHHAVLELSPLNTRQFWMIGLIVNKKQVLARVDISNPHGECITWNKQGKFAGVTACEA